MGGHWVNVELVLGLLAYIVKDADPDGIELWFASSDKRVTSKTSTILLDTFRSNLPKGDSDISLRLNEILRGYQATLDHHAAPRGRWLQAGPPRAARPLSLYILTDGLWQPRCHVEQPIEYLVDKLDALKYCDNQVGIQFIRFGNDPDGMHKLKCLDEDLKLSRCVRDNARDATRHDSVDDMLLMIFT